MPDLPLSPFTHDELSALGLTYATLRRHIQEGRIRRVMAGVYVRTDLPDSPELRARCAARILPAHQVISDHSAAWIHGIDVYDHALERLPIPPLLTTVSVGGDRTRRPEALGGKRDLSVDDVCTFDGITVTTPVRTACDLATLRGRRSGLAVLDSFLHAGLFSRRELVDQLPRYARRRGVVQLRELAALADGRAESPGESWTRLELLDSGLRAVTPQYEIEVPGYGMARLDLAYVLAKVVVEYDGEEFHSSPRQRERDIVRRRALEQLGWTVVVVRKEDFEQRRLDRWLRQVRLAVTHRPPTIPGQRRWARGPRDAV